MKVNGFRVGDRVRGEVKGLSFTGTVRFVDDAVHVERDDRKTGTGRTHNGRDTWICNVRSGDVMSDGSNGGVLEFDYNRIPSKMEGGKKMKIENFKKENLKEAKKQFEEERMNEEVRHAKEELTRATNEIDRLDREIKMKEDNKKPYLEIIAKFKGK